MASRKPTAIDLFSGSGGLTLGLKRAGFRVIGALELDTLAVKTYLANHPDVAVWEADIRKIPVSHVMQTLELRPGDVDLLAGCPPCQGFSALRTKNGSMIVRDPRNDLTREMLRFVRVLRPRSVMMENVPGLRSHVQFREFCRSLRRLGYRVKWSVKNAANYGVPQRRKRLILLAGYKFDIPFAPESGTYLTVRDAIGHLKKSGQSGDPLHDMPEKRSAKISDLIKDVPKNGGSRLDLPRGRQLACHRACDGFKDVYGRMAWDDVAPTITSGCFNPSKGRFLHPAANRAITMREAALLQSFPERYKFPDHAGKQAVALMIGNALPPEFIRRHAKQIITKLDQVNQ